MNTHDANLLVGLLGVAIGLVSLLATILIAAFGALGGLIIAAFITGSAITAALMWRYRRRAPP
jgi:hypothetical protein